MLWRSGNNHLLWLPAPASRIGIKYMVRILAEPPDGLRGHTLSFVAIAVF